MTPFLAPLFDFVPGTQERRDTNGFSRAQDFAKNPPFEGASSGGWLKGEKMDLAEWLVNCRKYAGSFKNLGEIDATKKLSQTEAAAAALAVLEEFELVLDEIRTASHRPYARFNIHYANEDPAAILLPHLNVVRRLCHVLALRASAKLVSGQIEQSYGDISLAMHLADSLKNEPIIISQLVRVACFQLALQVVWEGLAEQRWTEPQLQAWQARLQNMNLLNDYMRALNGGERMGFGNRLFDFLIKNPAVASQIAGSSEAVAFRFLPRGWLYFERLNCQHLYEEAVLPGVEPDAKRVHPKAIENKVGAMINALDSGAKHPLQRIVRHQFMAALLIPAVGRSHRKLSNAQCVVDQAAIACALERHRLKHGAFPESMDALSPDFMAKIPHDVITGQPMKYRRTNDGQFVLYSVGWNEKDDGNAVAFQQGTKNIDFDQGDWVWRYPAK
jgi:hypothetical protein